MPIRVYLKLRNAAEAEARATAVSDPDNPAYGQYLTPAQVRDAFSPPTAATSAQVSRWLAGQGLVGRVRAGQPDVRERPGSAAQVEAAFATRLDRYRVRGTEVRAPVDRPERADAT